MEREGEKKRVTRRGEREKGKSKGKKEERKRETSRSGDRRTTVSPNCHLLTEMGRAHGGPLTPPSWASTASLQMDFGNMVYLAHR